jgi:hypothetical protein
MRRAGIFLFAVIALVAMAGPVSAQPKVTITGLVDTLTTWNRNMSNVDNNPSRASDTEWYSRVRVRPDITAEVGTTKFVLGLEIDEAFGQTGNFGAAGSCGGSATGVGTAAVVPAGQVTATNGGVTAGTAIGSSQVAGAAPLVGSPTAGAQVGPVGTGGGALCSFPQRGGSSGGFQLNTDTMGVIEIKWAYTEFDMPLIPIPTRVRVGAQPWDAQYKLAALANGDFAGIHVSSQWNPMIKTNFSYAQIEEQSTGVRDGFIRGDDFAIVTSIEITPFKGLDLRPIFSYANFVGVTSASSRTPKGGINTGAGQFPTGNNGAANVAGAPVGFLAGSGCGAAPGFGCFSNSAIEDRFTVGLDARWRFGPFSLDPTVFYQFGKRDQVVAVQTGQVNGAFNTLKLDAWLVDIRGGWQAGPLLLEAAAIYTTGNRASDRIDRNASRIKYYQPISTDTSYFSGGWGEMFALGVDYFNIVHSSAAGLNPGASIGYDKYGLVRFGTRASYALTPAFTVRAVFNANWTDKGVDTQTSTITTQGAGASGVAPCTGTGFAAAVAANGQGACTPTGNASYLGSELNVGFQWRFVENVALDMVYAHLWAGNAMSSVTAQNANTGATLSNRNPTGADMVVARIRYTF